MSATVGHTPEGLGWDRLTLMQQMANVGSEVERCIRAHESGKVERMARALDRALALFDLTAADARWSGPRRREILRAREQFCELFFGDDPPASSAEGLKRYFLAFAVAARVGR